MATARLNWMDIITCVFESRISLLESKSRSSWTKFPPRFTTHDHGTEVDLTTIDVTWIDHYTYEDSPCRPRYSKAGNAGKDRGCGCGGVGANYWRSGCWVSAGAVAAAGTRFVAAAGSPWKRSSWDSSPSCKGSRRPCIELEGCYPTAEFFWWRSSLASTCTLALSPLGHLTGKRKR
jgi:hypothetical protein